MDDPSATTAGPAAPGPILVPPLPPLPEEMLARHERAHARLAARVRAASPAAAAVFVHLARRLLVEALANLQPTWIDPHRPRLLPPPRAFLDDRLTTRRRAAAEAFRYLDARNTMVRLGALPDVVDHAVPEVLNALLQAAPRASSASDETNPGLVRATSTWWMPDANPFVHPPPDRCRPLLGAAVELVRAAPAPAIARAGWLGFMVNTVHPFVDGNGRTVRALALGLASAGPTGTDWGLLEQWTLDRDGYIGALQAGQRARSYAPSTVDPAPFMRFTLESSVRGAGLTLERLTLLERLVDEVGRRGATERAARALVHTLVERFVRLDELVTVLEQAADTEARPDVGAHELVMALVRSGSLRWAEAPPGWPTGRGLAPGEPLADLVEVCVDAVAREGSGVVPAPA